MSSGGDAKETGKDVVYMGTIMVCLMSASEDKLVLLVLATTERKLIHRAL